MLPQPLFRTPALAVCWMPRISYTDHDTTSRYTRKTPSYSVEGVEARQTLGPEQNTKSEGEVRLWWVSRPLECHSASFGSPTMRRIPVNELLCNMWNSPQLTSIVYLAGSLSCVGGEVAGVVVSNLHFD